MGERIFELGIVGLGVMGRNLLLSLAEQGFPVAGYDRDPGKLHDLRQLAAGRDVLAAASLAELCAALRPPRVAMALVPAGAPVDAVLGELLPLLEPGDIVVDGGNSHFKDSNRRAQALEAKHLVFLGLGISGGESGARHGASLMAGGPRGAYERARPLFEAAAARADGEPCAVYLGPGSAGHYVKMVHNGIEYALMQLISESYDLLKRGLGLGPEEQRAVYERWSRGELRSYLMEISALILGRLDEKSGHPLLDLVLDEAAQKGTGRWASQDAMDLGVPVPTIDAAVAMRNLSSLKSQRVAVGHASGGHGRIEAESPGFVDRLGSALYAAMLLSYAQGFAQLRAASEAYGYGLSLESVARVWRAGCIIRSGALVPIRAALREQPGLPSLLLDPRLGAELRARQPEMREVVRAAAHAGLPVPGLMASLAYFDAYRSAWLPANLIQAQRDFFGAHTYQRLDAPGNFHSDWSEI